MHQHKPYDTILFVALILIGFLVGSAPLLFPFIQEQLVLFEMQHLPLYPHAEQMVKTDTAHGQITTFQTTDTPSQVKQFYETALHEQGREDEHQKVKTWIVDHYRLIEHTANSGTSFYVTVTISVKDGRTVV
jgi:hypothetical protein